MQSHTSSILFEHFRLTRRDLTKELWTQHSSEIMPLVVSQYFNKDPSSRGLSYDDLYEYFKEEYDHIFTKDESYIQGFLFYNEKEEIVGTMMLRDAFLYTESHNKILEKMKETDSFYDYYVQFCKIANGYWKKYSIGPGECVYGTDLAFSSKYLEPFKEKQVLQMILAVFINLNSWWLQRRDEGKFRYSIWTQFRKSLITTTEALFNCLESEDFKFLAGDNSKVEGKLFFVEPKSEEEIKNLWMKSSKI